MSSVYLRAASVLLAVLVLAACGGDDGEEPQKVGETAGLTQYEVSSFGFSVGVPTSWETVSADDRPSEEELEEFFADDPQMRPFIDAMSGEDSLIKFMALDPDASGGFATNLNVVVESPPTGLTRQEYFEATRGQVDQLLSEVEVEVDQVSLPAGQALRLSYDHSRTPNDMRVSVIQYVLFEGGTGYTLTFTTLPTERSSRTPEFERSARSFQVDAS
jgi:hypothetical protein